MATPLLNVVDLEVSDAPSAPLSFDVVRGEIHGLFCPPQVDRGPLLRVLAGLDRPRAGRVDMPLGFVRVAMIGIGSTVGDAFGSAPDAVLFDDPPAAANDRQDHDHWARLAAERERGTTIIVATSREEQAYRSDRVSLAMWDEVTLRGTYQRLSQRVSLLVDEFLRLLDQGNRSSYRSVALRLMQLNHATRDLIDEGRRHSHSLQQWRALSSFSKELAGQQLDDGVLESLIGGANED
jgi:hypothetical protein